MNRNQDTTRERGQNADLLDPRTLQNTDKEIKILFSPDDSAIGRKERLLLRTIIVGRGLGAASGEESIEINDIYLSRQHVRFSYANTLENLERAVERLQGFLGARGRTGVDDR